jgi:hypothetical protein
LNKEQYIRCEGEITDWDQAVYEQLVTEDLTHAQRERVETPPAVFGRQQEVLAIHWHPESVPLESIRKRIDGMFPAKQAELIIPTQHNRLIRWGSYTGVEADCYSPEFNRKVQLLFHFRNERLDGADVLKSMLNHTYTYRASQFHRYLDTVINPKFGQCLEEACVNTEVDDDTVQFVIAYTKKLNELVKKNLSSTPVDSLKNKLLPNYFGRLKEFFPEHFVNKALVFLREVKVVVKKNFTLDYFYQTREMIEEVRSLGGGIIVPHPEQFWPVLLADYDVDGYEVWNPQSREFTEFLTQVVVKKNKNRQYIGRPIIVTMGDDTHMSEKLKAPEFQDADKKMREVGLQPAWDDLDIRKSLIMGNFSRETVIGEYISRLS